MEFKPLWLAISTVSVLALAVAAPGGLALLGFLGIIIISHEAGHFFVARRAGMRPTEFFWGFGPEVAAVRIGDCRYGLKALWLGGYVKLEGMTPRSTVPDGFPESGTYRAASHWGRLATILAGPVVNLTTALVAFTVAGVLGGSGLLAAGAMAVGDLWFVVSATVDALVTWAVSIGAYTEAVLDGSGTTEAPVRFLSPIGQARVSGQAVTLGLGSSLQWLGILATAVGAINLLPLPPLDGSHAVVAVSERVAQWARRDPALRFDVTRLLPLAYLTIGVLVALSLSALVLDLRDLA